VFREGGPVACCDCASFCCRPKLFVRKDCHGEVGFGARGRCGRGKGYDEISFDELYQESG
jgi:hypothetical protein